MDSDIVPPPMLLAALDKITGKEGLHSELIETKP